VVSPEAAGVAARVTADWDGAKRYAAARVALLSATMLVALALRDLPGTTQLRGETQQELVAAFWNVRYF
jgi:hypothetical protein